MKAPVTATTLSKPMKSTQRKEMRPVFVTWFVLAVVAFVLAAPTIRDTGLDYDEAVYGHLAKDFLHARHCPQHMPGSQSVDIRGRPFPTFVQGYLGAVKCWLLLPGFMLFGETVMVMRCTMLFCGLLGVLCLMLWARRALGAVEAMILGPLLVFDPAFLFPTICEWGAFVPSFVCRCVALWLLTIWWSNRRMVWMILTGATLGIGFLNKIDFVVVLLTFAGAALTVRRREILTSLRRDFRQWIAGLAAFIVTSLPMLLSLAKWSREVLAVQSGARAGEMTTKFNIIKSALDGSYFQRLMESGGMFHCMFDSPASNWPVFGIVLLLAIIALAIHAAKHSRAKAESWPFFLLTGLLISFVGFLLLPDALRIHHLLLVYPFPQLIIASSATRLWRMLPAKSSSKIFTQTLTNIALLTLLGSQLLAIRSTQQFVSSTAGRGTWSTALTEFAREVCARDDLFIASLDWGTHEQLSFLTDGPKLYDLTWNLQEGKPVSLMRGTNCFYLIHPPEFSLFNYGKDYLEAAQLADPGLIVESRTNREGRVMLQIFRFSRP